MAGIRGSPQKIRLRWVPVFLDQRGIFTPQVEEFEDHDVDLIANVGSVDEEQEHHSALSCREWRISLMRPHKSTFES